MVESELLIQFWKSQIIANCQTQASKWAIHGNNIFSWKKTKFIKSKPTKQYQLLHYDTMESKSKVAFSNES